MVTPGRCREEDTRPKKVKRALAPVTGTFPCRLARVQAALRRRAADLRDSLVLSEFLQDLQEEEARSRQEPAAVSSGARRPSGLIVLHLGQAQGLVCVWQGDSMHVSHQPSYPGGVTLHLSHAWSFCWLQPGSGCCGSQGPFPLLSVKAGQPPSSEDMSQPLGELQEAVEMLNDAAKERERVMEVAAETESLERLVGDRDGRSGDAAGWSTYSWTSQLVGKGHVPQLVPVGHKGIGIHGDCAVRGWYPHPSQGWCSLPFCRRMAGCPQAGVGWGCMMSDGTGVPCQGSSLFFPLPIQVAEVSPCLEALRCRAEALARDTAQAESGFTAVKSEKDLQGLQDLLSQQQEMEVRPGEHRGWPCPWWGGVPAGWGPPGEVLLVPGGPGAVSLGKVSWAGVEFSSRAEPCPAPLLSTSTGQAKGESLHQLPCASARLPAPHSSSRYQQGGDSHGQSRETRQPSALPVLPSKGGSAPSLQPLCQHPPFHPCILLSIPTSSPPSLHPGMQGNPAWAQRGWMHPEPFPLSACGVGDPAGAAGGAGEGGCPLARALPR